MKKFTHLFAVFISMALLLTSCQKFGEEKNTSPNSDLVWTAEFYDSQYFGLDITPVSGKSDGEYVYFTTVADSGRRLNADTGEYEIVCEEKYTEYYRWKIGSAPEKINVSGTISQKHSNISIMQPDGNGNFYIIIGNCIAKIDENGNQLNFTDAEIPMWFTTAVDSEGRLFVAGDGGMLSSVLNMYDTDCSLTATIEDKVRYVTNTPDGKVFGAAPSTVGNIYRMNFNSTDMETVTSSTDYNIFSGYDDNSILYTAGDSLYIYNLDTGKTDTLFLCSNLGVNYARIMSICTLNDGSIVAFLADSEANSRKTVVYSIAHISLAESEKTTLTIGTFSSNSTLAATVTEFNRQNAGFSVEIRQYYDPETDTTLGKTGYLDALSRFHMDIVSGNCPDIINLPYDDLENYVSQNLFEDLSPFLEKSGLEILETVKNAYTFDGVLAAITPQFCIRTIVGRAEDLMGMNRWTSEELMELLGNNTSFFNTNPRAMLSILLKLNLDSFVDYKNYTCDFQNENFYKILLFAAMYNGISGNTSGYNYIYSIADYDAVFYEIVIASPYDYIMLQQFLGSESIIFIGFPNNSGNEALLESPNGSYAISALSENKQAAWEFIEFMLQNISTEENISPRGFPTVNSIRDELFENSMAEPWTKPETQWDSPKRRYVTNYRRKNLSAYYYVPFQNEVEPLLNLINLAKAPIGADSTIMDIILENASEYFSGNITAEEAARRIQSRVMIYLGEKK